MSPWVALKCADGYLGQQWEPNGSGGLTSPRTALVELQEASLYPNRTAAQNEAARARQILGRGFSVIGVRIEGSGKDARIVAIETGTPELES